VGPLSDDRGQALVWCVIVLGIAAVALGGLRVAQEQLFAQARMRRASEAGVEAATAVIADAYVAELRAGALRSTHATFDVARALSEPRAREAARIAASDLSLRNGGDVVGEITVSCAVGRVTVSLVAGGVSYRAGFVAPECSQP
jgi:hypothetical protein